MAVEILALNTKDGLADPSRSVSLFDSIMRVNPDVAIFNEAYAAERHDSDELGNTMQRLANEGFDVCDGLYEDSDNRGDAHGYVGMSRNGGQGRLASMGTRNALVIQDIVDNETGTFFDFIGAHLDDRSEATRVRQAAHIVGRMLRPGMPVALGMDANNMHRSAKPAPLLRRAEPYVSRLPTVEPAAYHASHGLRRVLKIPARIGSIGTRACGMAEGRTMRLFESVGLRDADELHRPTMKIGPIAAQIDHVMVNDYVTVVTAHPPVHVPDTDHKGVHVTIRL